MTDEKAELEDLLRLRPPGYETEEVPEGGSDERTSTSGGSLLIV